MRFFLLECTLTGGLLGYGASLVLQGRPVAALIFFAAALVGATFATLIFREEATE